MTDQPPPSLRYSADDSARANREWKAACGPHSLAAALGLSLAEVRPALVGYRGWMNPTQMGQALQSLGRAYELRSHLRTPDLCDGINRIQWEGSWLNSGVPARIAYHHTHWVARCHGWVLCASCDPAAWIPEEEWRNFHLTVEPVSPFHVTHHYRLPVLGPVA